MITIRNWVATIPEEDKHIGYVGEDGAVYRKFLITDWEGYRNWVFYLDIAFDLTTVTSRDSRQVVTTQEDVTETVAETQVKTAKTGKKETYTKETVTVDVPAKTDVAYLSRKETEEGLVLTWKVLAQQTQLPGKLYANLRAEGPFGEVKKSALMVFEVDHAVVAEPAAAVTQSTFEVMKEDMNALCQIGYEQAAQTAANAETAANAAEEAVAAAGLAADHRQVCEEAVSGVQQSVSEARYAAEDAETAAATASTAAEQAQTAATAAANDVAQAQENRVIAANAAAKLLYLKDVAECYEHGKNLYDPSKAHSGYKLVYGILKESTEHITTDFILHTQVGGTCAYTVSAANAEENEEYTVEVYDVAQVFVYRAYGTIGQALTFDDTEAPYNQCGYMRFCFKRTLTDLQIEVGDTATAYEPYRPPMVKREYLPVDTALDANSGNPVANSAVAGAMDETNRCVAELNGILNGIEPDSEPVETVTVTNLVTNPQFENGTAGYSMVNGTGWDMTATDGVLCLTATAPENKINQLRTPNVKSALTGAVGHRVYVCAKVKYEGMLPPTVSAKPSGTEGTHQNTLETTKPILDQWCCMSSIVDLLTLPSSSMYVLISNNYGTTDIIGAKCYVDNIMCIDLTASFGEGNEPDLATMDRWVAEQYADGFEGTVTLSLTAEDNEAESEHTLGLVDKVKVLETDVADLKVDVADLAEAMENLPNTEVQQTGTVYPALQDHFIANIEAAKPDYYGKQDANTLTFAMMADMHLLADNKTILPNVEASSAWAKLVNHDFVMMGGDFIIGDENKAASLGYIDALMEMAEKHANCPVYAVKGNHDSCDGTDDKADRITAKEFYLHANVRGEKYGMVTDPAHPYAGYYYVDFPRQKIRMVCLNTTEIKEDVDVLTCTNSQLVWAGVKSTYQVEWVRDVALRVPEGWAVMMVSHIPPITGSELGVTDEAANADNAAPFHNRGISSPAVVALCRAFADGTAGTANVTASGSVKISYDFTEQGAREFIGHFCGHVHEDSLSVYNGMNYVVVNSTTPTKRWATSLDRTASEDKLSLNSFIIDRANRTVKCIKIGATPDEDNVWWADSFTW